jgi:hypothetical protein
LKIRSPKEFWRPVSVNPQRRQNPSAPPSTGTKLTSSPVDLKFSRSRFPKFLGKQLDRWPTYPASLSPLSDHEANEIGHQSLSNCQKGSSISVQ